MVAAGTAYRHPCILLLSPSSDLCTVQEVARLAEEINTSLDNIGARRLHTVLERILEQISFDAPDKVRALPGLQSRR